MFVHTITWKKMLIQGFAPLEKLCYRLKKKMIKTSDDNLTWGLLVPIETGGVEFCSVVVWVQKGGIITICAAYKKHAIDKTNTKAYSLPCIETIFSKISGAKSFAKTEIRSSFLAKYFG